MRHGLERGAGEQTRGQDDTLTRLKKDYTVRLYRGMVLSRRPARLVSKGRTMTTRFYSHASGRQLLVPLIVFAFICGDYCVSPIAHASQAPQHNRHHHCPPSLASRELCLASTY